MPEARELMAEFIRAKPKVWNEDIGEEDEPGPESSGPVRPDDARERARAKTADAADTAAPVSKRARTDEGPEKKAAVA